MCINAIIDNQLDYAEKVEKPFVVSKEERQAFYIRKAKANPVVQEYNPYADEL